jgi:hypothetical protein
MTGSNVQRKTSLTKDKQVLSADDATLDSFYSLVANIAMRLTAGGKKNNTTGIASVKEAKS